MGALKRRRIVKEPLQSTGWDLNPRHRITGAESWPLDDQCVLFPCMRRKMGSDGLEPSPTRVRTERAAANTLIPCCLVANRRGKWRVESRPQPRFRLAALSRQCRDGVGGIRTHARLDKSQGCCRYTTTPDEDVATFASTIALHDWNSWLNFRGLNRRGWS